MDTKTSLLDAAETLARRRGFDAFSYADLAQAVGIRKASIHHHFPTKADLALSMVTRYREGFAVELSKIASQNKTAGAQLGAYLALYKSAMDGGEQVCLCISFSVSHNSFDAQVLRQVNRFHAESLAWLEHVFEKALLDQSVTNVRDPAEEAQACLAQAEGAQLIARASGEMSDFDQAVKLMAARIR